MVKKVTFSSLKPGAFYRKRWNRMLCQKVAWGTFGQCVTGQHIGRVLLSNDLELVIPVNAKIVEKKESK